MRIWLKLEKQLECSVNKFELGSLSSATAGGQSSKKGENAGGGKSTNYSTILYHQVATLEQQHAAVAMVKPEEQQRMLEEFQFFGDEQPISNLLQLAPLPPQFQPCRVQPTQPNLQDSISLPKSSFRQQSKVMHLPGFGLGSNTLLLLCSSIMSFDGVTAGAALAFDITSGGVALAEKIIRQTMDPSEEHHSIGPTGKLHKHKPQATER
ncbi:hypothetical protein D5086_027460 [Populus alba]|uniref:Uncharacterized protein n=1 Tax=Populus alba TaxID=43335 RepID=A0ACC4AW02_POPAL